MEGSTLPLLHEAEMSLPAPTSGRFVAWAHFVQLYLGSQGPGWDLLPIPLWKIHAPSTPFKILDIEEKMILLSRVVSPKSRIAWTELPPSVIEEEWGIWFGTGLYTCIFGQVSKPWGETCRGTLHPDLQREHAVFYIPGRHFWNFLFYEAQETEDIIEPRWQERNKFITKHEYDILNLKKIHHHFLYNLEKILTGERQDQWSTQNFIWFWQKLLRCLKLYPVVLKPCDTILQCFLD